VTVTATDLFCGAGGSSIGFELAGGKLRLGLNHWQRAIETHSANFQHADHDCEDVASLTTAQIRRYPDSDILLASPECFPAGTLVTTVHGQVPIECVPVGEVVLTHRGRWRVVTRVQQSRAGTIVVRGQGHTPGIETTLAHPFWLRRSGRVWENRVRQSLRRWDKPEWLSFGDASPGEVYWATPAPTGHHAPLLEPTETPACFGSGPRLAWWLIGRWVADGSLTFDRGRCEITITCGFHEEEELAAKLDATGATWQVRALRTCAAFRYHDEAHRDWLAHHFGHGSAEKGLPGWTLDLPREQRRELLAGYVSGDGTEGSRRVQVDTVSHKLAVSVRLLAESLGHRCGLYRYEQHATQIEGRDLNVQPIWKVAWEATGSTRETYQAPGEQQSWSRVREVSEGRPDVEVFNLEVDEDESYIAEGIVVHNCTNHSLAKGARRQKPQAGSLFDDGPAGDAEQERSRATMWDVVRFTEQKRLKGKPYKAIVVENVVDAFKWGHNDDGGLFTAWRQAMGALGYDHEIVWLNSMFCPPTPQSRDRLYVVFWLREMRRPDLRFEPRSWCPACLKIIDGRQTWKRPDRTPWGRYGAQYFYGCPECHGTVLPGVFPASSILDRSLPAPAIGERDRPLAANTRERIRRGLERLASEPFAIRLLQGGSPRPLTLPVVTLTQRHDMAMVTPVAGNTYERTPGNRARDAQWDPLATVHGTLEQAMVIPPMGNVDARDAETRPLPTQTTTTRSALVMANRMHGVPSPADESPTPTACTGETLGVVEVQNHGGVKDPAMPLHTIRAGGHHHAVVMRNNDGPNGHMCTPEHEPIRTVATRGHQSVLIPYQSGSEPVIAEQAPASTVLTHHKHALLIPYDRTGSPAIADLEPTQTLTTRDRIAVVLTDQDIDACGFRMFALHEIAAAMAMRDHPHNGGEYLVLGNKRERMAQYGNGVTPPVMTEIVRRLLPILDETTA
jgi:site-specific DNA-cytosine methylase